MQVCFFVLFLFLGTAVRAYDCPSQLTSHPSARKAYDWLKKFKGTRQLHGCTLEITLCQESTSTQDSAPLGEILLIDAKKREVYVPLVFPNEDENFFTAKAQSHSRMFHYFKKDRFYEEENGRTEVWRLELRTLWDNPTTLNLVEIGVYTTYSQLNHPNGNDSHWSVCGPEKK